MRKSKDGEASQEYDFDVVYFDLVPYSLSKLEKALGTQGQHLSSILLRLGWGRRRKWTGKAEYLRYWIGRRKAPLPFM